MSQTPEHQLECERWPQDYVATYANQLSRATLGNPSSQAKEKIIAAHKKLRAVAGKLSLVMKVPVDIFLEIIGHLHPRDVLYLARTSKQLRELLMSKHSRGVWRLARANVGLPDCPQELSEPEYANLVFSTECQICGAQKILKADYFLKLRLCQSCSAANILSGRKIVKEIDPKLVKDPTVYNLVPCRDAHRRIKIVDNTHRFCGKKSDIYFKPAFVDALERYLVISREKDEERLRTFTMTRHNAIVMSIIHAGNMQNWMEAEKEAVTAENLARRSRRQKEILDGLYALGYTSDDMPKRYESGLGNSLRKEWDQLFNRNQVMNERSWKAILPKLEDILRRTMERRHEVTLKRNRFLREKEVSNLYDAYILSNFSDAYRALVPNAWDLLALFPVRELIEEDACAAVITEQRWQPVFDLVIRDRFFEAYKQRVIEDCRLGLAAACPDAQENSCWETLSDTPAYVIVAEKTNFGNIETWKESTTLHDALLTRSKTKYNGTIEPSPGFIEDISFPKSVWDAEKLRFDSDAIYAARSLLSSCGMSLETPVTEMLEYGTELKCARCPAECKRRMTWVEIACHYAEETKLYSKAVKNLGAMTPRLDDIVTVTEEPHCLTFLNTHGFECDSPTIMFPIGKDTTMKRYSEYERGRFQCNICSFVDIRRVFKLQAELEAHIRAIHAKEPNLRDMKTIS